MIEPEDFAKNFPNAAIPDALTKILEFQNNTSKSDFFASGFELIVNEPPGMLETYSEKSEFLEAFSVFAQVSEGGSVSAIWHTKEHSDLSSAPIIVFGDEGGYHVIAQNILEFMQLLTLDVEPSIGWDGVSMEREDDDSVSPASKTYKSWLKTNFNLTAIKDAEPIIAAAQTKHQKIFEKWMSKYYSQ
jgi:hypothetical protein